VLTASEINHIARLAKLRLEPEELAVLSADLSRVVDYIALLDDVTLDPGAEARVVSDCHQPAGRDDVVAPGITASTFLENAPQTLDRFLLVPAIK